MNPIYTEEQKFDQKPIQLIMFGILIAMVILSVVTILVEKSYIGIFPFVLGLLFITFFQIMKLETNITGDKICFRFFPLQINSKCIKKSEISKIKIIKYHPITDYGGWGIRLGKAGKAYTISGSIGISITLNTGTNLLIGTKQPELAAKFLNENGYPLIEE